MRFDTQDLVSRCVKEARRPSVDQAMSGEDWCRFLSDAQEHWYDVFSVVVPHVLYGAPVKLTTADSGKTFSFGTDADGNAIFPLGAVEIRATRAGSLLLPGAEFDPATDFVQEGDKIRIPGGRSRTFGDGPWARFITPPRPITLNTETGSTDGEPSLKPVRARELLVYRAVALWAAGPGQRDPESFLAKERRRWLGDPDMGDHGMLAALRNQFYGSGNEGARSGPDAAWWRGMDDGTGYVRGS